MIYNNIDDNIGELISICGLFLSAYLWVRTCKYVPRAVTVGSNYLGS